MKRATTKTVVSRDGKIRETQTEVRYPYSTEILMTGGFPIILLNMIFGLLPMTLYGTNLKYLRCSVAQLYALSFGLCMVILSFLFVPVAIMEDLSDAGDTRTGTTVMVLIRVTHVCGFLFLLIRGHSVAKKMPLIWNQLAKLLQMAIVDVHGRKYHFAKRIVSYGRWSTLYYLVVLSYTQIFSVFFQLESTLPSFYGYYKIPPFGLPAWNTFSIQMALTIWQFCSLSHVIVSMLVGYLIVTIKVCLRSINDQLMAMFEGGDGSQPLLTRKRELVKYNSPFGLEDESITIEKLNRVKDVMVVAEDLTSSISRLWGISLIIEVLILIANLLVNLYYILVDIKPRQPNVLETFGNENGTTDNDLDTNSSFKLEYKPPLVTFIGSINEAVIHCFFFYRLCCTSTDMVNEANMPLQILKSVPYQRYSKRIQKIIQSLKSDLSSTDINLSATNYFKINKFLLTSVTGAITTYIVVLLQFEAQDQQNSK